MGSMDERLKLEQPVAVWRPGFIPWEPDGTPFDCAIFADGTLYFEGRRSTNHVSAEGMRQLMARLEFPSDEMDAIDWRIKLAQANAATQ